MNKYRLFSEWRGISILGTDFADALTREKVLRAPDKTEMQDRINQSGNVCGRGPVVVEKGEGLVIATIHAVTIPDRITRGDQKIHRAVVEFEDGKIREVDAVLEQTYD